VAILTHCDSKQLSNCKAFVHGTALSIYASRIPSPGHLSQAAEDHKQIALAVLAGDVDRSIQTAFVSVNDVGRRCRAIPRDDPVLEWAGRYLGLGHAVAPLRALAGGRSPLSGR